MFPRRWDLPTALRALTNADIEVEAFNDVHHGYDHGENTLLELESQRREAIGGLMRLDDEVSEARRAINDAVLRAHEKEREKRSTPTTTKEV